MTATSALPVVTERFRREGLEASSEWLTACLDWCLREDSSNPPKLSSPQAASQACLEQWLATDLCTDGVQNSSVRRQFSPAEIAAEISTATKPGLFALQVTLSQRSLL